MDVYSRKSGKMFPESKRITRLTKISNIDDNYSGFGIDPVVLARRAKMDIDSEIYGR